MQVFTDDQVATEAGRALADKSAALVSALLAEKPLMQRRSRGMDAAEGFPSDLIDRLRDIGALLAPIPPGARGLGWATEPGGAPYLAAALRIIGSASLGLGRIYEAHVNAVALIARFGDQALRESAWTDMRNGHLFALWIASGVEPVRAIRRGAARYLVGTKPFCTAGDVATRAVTSFTLDNRQEQLVVIATDQVIIGQRAAPMHGMGNTSTRALSFDQALDPSQWLGKPGDYFVEPDFSAGAWRTSAVTAGGLASLVEEVMTQLRARQRHSDPHQSRRIGLMLIACETARMWVEEAARRAVVVGAPSADVTAYVNLARLAVEQVCLDVIALVQRSLGLSAMMASNPVEAMFRDLATYLRQPAADEALSEAAIHVAQQGRSLIGGILAGTADP